MDVDESSQSHQLRQPTISNAYSNDSDSPSEDDESTDTTDNTDNNEPSDSYEDLTVLNTTSLRKKITSEVIVFFSFRM